MFLSLDQEFHIYTLHRDTWRDTARGHEAVLQLEVAISWLQGSVDILRQGYSRVERARAVLTPVLRLNADMLSTIFEQLAENETPTKKALGWIRLSRVCSPWKDVLLGMRSLWARDLYALGPTFALNCALPLT